MHLVFMPYGVMQEVEHFKIDLQAQKFLIPMTKGKESQMIWVQGNLRLGPFGVWEYVFPKEFLDMILTTLTGDNTNFHYAGKLKLAVMRKALKCEPIPETFNQDKKFIWYKDNVALILIGVRPDRDITDVEGKYAGWTHEAM